MVFFLSVLIALVRAYVVRQISIMGERMATCSWSKWILWSLERVLLHYMTTCRRIGSRAKESCQLCSTSSRDRLRDLGSRGDCWGFEVCWTKLSVLMDVRSGYCLVTVTNVTSMTDKLGEGCFVRIFANGPVSSLAFLW